MRIYLEVALAVDARSSVSGSTYGGGRMPVPFWYKAEPLRYPGRTLLCSAWVQEKVRVPELVGTGKEEPDLV